MGKIINQKDEDGYFEISYLKKISERSQQVRVSS
jgi:hypothetical protein